MDVAALKSSWRWVADIGDEATQYFYSHLFLMHPEVREMFPVSMTLQREKFFAALGAIISDVDNLDAQAEFLAQLGRDHRRFQVIPEQYDAVGASLLATLAHLLGESWTPELAATWAEAYGAVATAMVAAAEDAADTPSWWDAEIVATERRSIDVTVHTLAPAQPYPFRAGQSAAVEFDARPRAWRYYSPANAPRDDGTIELHVQVVAGGQVSSAFARARPGSRVRLGAPIGESLTLPEGVENLLLVAGGTGLAPLRAILEQIDTEWQHNGFAPNVHLFHGIRNSWNMYDNRALLELAARPWLSYTAVVSDDPFFPGARGPVGTVAARSGDWQKHHALVCGSAGMVGHTVNALADAGMAPTAIGYEDFTDFTVPTAGATTTRDRPDNDKGTQ